MEINDINDLKKDSNNDNLYNLTQRTFKFPANLELESYTIQSGEEMRIDLVCQSIYGNTNYIDIILNINNIDNPLNIKVGETIQYPTIANLRTLVYDDIQQKQSSKNVSDQVQVITPQKATRRDLNRKKYVEEKFSLPPTVLSQPVEQVKVTDDKVIIGTGLFNK